MIVSIVGVGLIGGSMAIDLKRLGFADKVLGVETYPAGAAAALKMGLVDEVVGMEDAIDQGDIIVLAVPVDTATRMLSEVLDRIDGDKIVIDTCSTKSNIVRAVKYHPKRRHYVATHPMAGTERIGYINSKASILENAFYILTKTEKTTDEG